MLRLGGTIGMRSRCSNGRLSMISMGRPRLSGPNSRASPRAYWAAECAVRPLVVQANTRLGATAARKVFDVTGAGDTVIAATALGLAAGVDLVTAAVLANHAAGIVVGEVGAAVVTAEQLLAEISTQPRIPVERWV